MEVLGNPVIKVKRIGVKNKDDINIANEPFSVYGKIIPAYKGTEQAGKSDITFYLDL